MRVKQAASRHTQSEREITASDVEEMKKPQAEIAAIEKETDGLCSTLKALAAEYQKAQKLSERELNEVESEYKRNLQAIYNEAVEIERAQEEAYKVYTPNEFFCHMKID